MEGVLPFATPSFDGDGSVPRMLDVRPACHWVLLLAILGACGSGADAGVTTSITGQTPYGPFSGRFAWIDCRSPGDFDVIVVENSDKTSFPRLVFLGDDFPGSDSKTNLDFERSPGSSDSLSGSVTITRVDPQEGSIAVEQAGWSLAGEFSAEDPCP
jgi:hypothetical protein